MKKLVRKKTKYTTALKLAACLMMASTALAITPSYQAYAESSVIYLKSTKQTKIIKLSKAKPKTVRTGVSFNEVVIGDPEVATVSPLTDRSFYVVGTKPGTTGIALYNEDKELVGSLDIEVGANASLLNNALKEALPSSSVKASTTNGRVVLKGKAKNAVEAQKARAIAEKYDAELIDTVKVKGSQQVKLEVRFIEAQRSRGKELGIGVRGRRQTNSSASLAQSNAISTAAGTALGSLISGSVPFGSFISSIIESGTNVDLAINALEERGVARRLAEPNLVALSGDTASFLAGGEFPIPVGADDGQITIEFKKFGVGLEFTPTVLEDDIINLKLAPEVSQVDNTNAIAVAGGIQVPALIVRRAETTLELRDGQSFVLAGLLQSNTQINKSQVPWIGDIPILGALFSSKAYQRDETDLVIIVTPRLVKPLRPGENPATPLDNTLAPNDVDLFVEGKVEVNRSQLKRLAESKNGALKAGHIIELE